MNDLGRIRVLRVVTSPECVLWHMGKTLQGLSQEFDVGVAGERVSCNRERFPGVVWFDIDIERKARLLTDLRALIRLCLVCHRFRPDIVHSIMPKAGLLTAIAGWVMRVPLRMHTFTGQVWDTKIGLSRRLYQQMDRLIVALNTVCLTDSPSQSQHLNEHGITLEGESLPVLGLGSLIGVDIERFDPDRIKGATTLSRASLGLGNEDFVVAYIARKSRDKGALDMLMGFEVAKRQAKNMRLLFIGPDESDGEIDSLRASRPEFFESVIERGAVMNHEEYLLVSDVLCLPSYREGFGTVVLDAAALGIPSIGSRIVGLVDSIVENRTGLLFALGDTQQMADCLCRLENDRGLLRRLGSEARQRVEASFSSETMTRLLADFYRKRFQALGPEL